MSDQKVASTEFQQNAGYYLDKSVSDGPVYITRYSRTRNVLMSEDEFIRLKSYEALVEGRLENNTRLKLPAKPEDITREDYEQWEADFHEAMKNGTPEEDAFFQNRRDKKLGVGLDESGNLVREIDRIP